MSDKLNNIEGLFKDSFENFEADVDPTIWENVSSQIGGQATAPDASSAASSSSGSSALVGSVAVKTIAIVGTAGLLTFGAYYLINSDSNEVPQVLNELPTEIIENEDREENIINSEETAVSQELSTEEDASYISATSQEPIAVEIETIETQITEPAAANNNEAKAETQPTEPSKAVAVMTSNQAKAEEKETVKTEPELAPVAKAHLIPSIYASVNSGIKPLNVDFENKGSQSADIRWKIAGEHLYDQEQMINHTFERSGKYWVVVEIRDETGQKSRDSVEITVEGNSIIKVPNVFTPNGDGVHDAFVIETEDIKSLRCSIMDRSGKIVFQWDNIYGHWDGRDMSGREMQAGIYFYVVEAVDSDDTLYRKKGTVSLYRN